MFSLKKKPELVEAKHKDQREANEKERKETITKINKTKDRFFQKINKIDKTFTTCIKKKREKTEINQITNDRGYNRQCRSTKDIRRLK